MRKLSLIVAGGALIAMLWALLSTPGAGGEEAPRSEAAAALPRALAAAPGQGHESGDGGQTLALDRSATAAEGQLEVKVTAQGKPRPGASVRLYWRGLVDPNTNQVDWRLAGGGTTGPDGTLRIPARPGTYLVSARAQGLAVARRELVRPLGEPLTRIELPLPPGLALRARTAAKKTGDPVPLVEVRLIAFGNPTPGERAQAPLEEQIFGTSDSRGLLQVGGLAPGRYRVEASAVGYARWVKNDLNVPYPGELAIALSGAGVLEGFVVDGAGRPAAGASVMVIGDEEPAVVTTGEGGGFSAEVVGGMYQLNARRGTEAGALPKRITVPAGTTVRGLKLELKAAGSLEGTVVAGSNGAPVQGALVSVSPYLKSGDLGRAVSGADGAFSVEGLPPGSYDVVVTAAGFSELSRRGVMLAAGQRFALELELHGTGAAEGTVLDSAGNPVAGALVREDGRLLGGLTSVPPQARTDAQGHYRLSGLDLGTSRLVALREEGVPGGAAQLVHIREGDTARADFSLIDGGSLQGRVTRQGGGLPTRPVEVHALPVQNLNASWGRNVAPLQPDGSYRLELPPGNYQVRLESAEQESWTNYYGSRMTTTIEAGQVTQLDLTASDEDASALTGQVLESDGTPSPRATVVVLGMNFNSGGLADGEGNFSVSLEGIPPGRELKVRARNGTHSGELKTAAGEGPLRVLLKSTGSVRGRILSSDGVPVTGFSLRTGLRASSGWMGWNSETREYTGDQYVLDDVPGGLLSLSAWTSDGRRGSAELSLGEGEEKQLDIPVDPGAALSGRLLDARTRAPLTDGVVYVSGGTAGGDGGPAHVGQDGSFRIPNVAPGQHLVRGWSTALRNSVERLVNLAPGQTLDLGDLMLDPQQAEPGTLGMQILRNAAGQILVASLIPDGPAERAGLRVGDQVEAVDGAPVKDALDAQQRLRGAPGTAVMLTVRHGGGERTVMVDRAG